MSSIPQDIPSPVVGGTLDIRSFIDARPLSGYQWLLIALCFLIVTADGMDVAIMGFIAPPIGAEWHVSRAVSGAVMGVAPIGLALGALFVGPLSDWFGRRKVLIGATLSFAICCILTSCTTNVQEMSVLRLLTGLGLGAAMPNSTTLLSEYAPQRSRSFFIAVMFAGFNLGSALIGFAAAYLIPHFGWRSVLVFGGCIPLILVPFLLVYLPESARFMVARGMDAGRVRKQLARVCGTDLNRYTAFVAPEPDIGRRMPVALVLSQGYRLRTFSLWVTYFMGLLVIYLTTGWLPTMMKDAGMSIDRAAWVTAMFQIGGTVGAVLIGWLMDRRNPNAVIGGAYILGGLFLVALGLGGLMSALLVLLVTIVGFCVSGAQTGLNAFAPSCYPTLARATGVSWMLGFGRLGSILGSSIGGVLLSFGWDFQIIFIVLAIPACIAGSAILLNRYFISRAL